MMELSHDNLRMKTTDSEDDTDEFEVISNEKAPVLEAQNSEFQLPISYKHKTPSISDISEMDSFDHRRINTGGANTPSVSGFSQEILDSLYTFPTVDIPPHHVNKLMDFVREEQEKSRNLIGTIISKIEGIKLEIKDTNLSEMIQHFKKQVLESELRCINAETNLQNASKEISMKNSKLEEMKKEIEKISHENTQLKKEFTILQSDFQNILNSLPDREEKIKSLDIENRSLSSKLIDSNKSFEMEILRVVNEKEKLQISLDETFKKIQLEQNQRLKLEEQSNAIAFENQKLRQEIESLNCQLSRKNDDNQNQKEIIKVLQEESEVLMKSVDATKKKYKERLNSLEEMVASYHARNETSTLSMNSSMQKRKLPNSIFRLDPFSNSQLLNNPQKTTKNTSNSSSNKVEQKFYICDLCLNAFPTKGRYISHQFDTHSIQSYNNNNNIC